MNKWKDYETNSQLVLVYGHVSASVQELDTNRMGVVLHPYSAFEVLGTRDQAKQIAEMSLRELLTLAQANLPPTDAMDADATAQLKSLIVRH